MFTRLGGLFAASLLLSGYYYLYLDVLSSGLTHYLSRIVLVHKALSFAAVVAYLFDFRVKRRFRIYEIIFIMFFAFSALVFLLKSSALGFEDILFLNTITCILPCLVLKAKGHDRLVAFLDSCLFVLTVQVLLDIYLIDYSGYALWAERPFVGGMGNPSIFGYVCVLSAIYILFLRRNHFSNMFYVPVVVFGVVKSNSLLSLVLLLVVFVVWALRQEEVWVKFATCLGVIFSAFWGWGILGDHALYKIRTAANVILGDGGDGSISITGRVGLYVSYFSDFQSDFLGNIFFGDLRRPYAGLDSQVITYFASFGIVIGSLFFVAYFMCIGSFWRHRSGFGFFMVCLLMVTAFSFLTNRMLDYYPVPLLLFIAVAAAQSSGELQYGKSFA